jgi:GABA(A) receptor-associated protein
MSFKNKVPLQQRIDESNRILSKYPDRVPIIIDCDKELDKLVKKRKFLAPRDISISHLAHIVRGRIQIESSSAMFMFCDNKLVSGQAIIGNIYDEYLKNRRTEGDKFLYITVAKETVFG